MRVLSGHRPVSRNQKSENQDTDAEIVFFDELNCGWVIDRKIIARAKTSRALGGNTGELILFNSLINHNKGIE